METPPSSSTPPSSPQGSKFQELFLRAFERLSTEGVDPTQAARLALLEVQKSLQPSTPSKKDGDALGKEEEVTTPILGPQETPKASEPELSPFVEDLDFSLEKLREELSKDEEGGIAYLESAMQSIKHWNSLFVQPCAFCKQAENGHEVKREEDDEEQATATTTTTAVSCLLPSGKPCSHNSMYIDTHALGEFYAFVTQTEDYPALRKAFASRLLQLSRGFGDYSQDLLQSFPRPKVSDNSSNGSGGGDSAYRVYYRHIHPACVRYLMLTLLHPSLLDPSDEDGGDLLLTYTMEGWSYLLSTMDRTRFDFRRMQLNDEDLVEVEEEEEREEQERLKERCAIAVCHDLSPDLFSRALTCVQQYITIRTYLEEKGKARLALELLSIFHKAFLFSEKQHAATVSSLESSDLWKVLRSSDFYNDALVEETFSGVGRIRELRMFFLGEAYEDTEDEEDEEDENPFFPTRQRPSRKEAGFDKSILSYPFLLNPHIKGEVLTTESRIKQRAGLRHSLIGMRGLGNPYFVLRVRREFVVQDTLSQLLMYEDAMDLKKPLKVVFEGEDGIDEGGVRKEYFQVMLRHLLDPNFGMFLENTENHTLWFNRDSYESIEEFRLIGNLVGIAIYNSVILDLHFPSVVYKKLVIHDEQHNTDRYSRDPLRRASSAESSSFGWSSEDETQGLVLEDVASVDGELYENLSKLLALASDDDEDEEEKEEEEDLGLTFEATYESFGALVSVPLCEDGESRLVTPSNVREYVELYKNWILVSSIEHQFSAFRRGFLQVCGGQDSVLSMFAPDELELLICGNPTLDFYALERNTHYEDGYDENSPAVRYFWSVIHSLPLEQQKLFLKFVSGSDRAPIAGLGSLNLVISRSGGSLDALPTSHTCFNHLLLPNYLNEEVMRDKLLIAIKESEGFGLR